MPDAPASFLDIVVPMRWTDLDAYGHVNNAAVVRLLEEARITAFWGPTDAEVARGAVRADSTLGQFGVDQDELTLVAGQRLDYHRPIEYLRDGVLVRVWVSHVGGASFDVDYHILRRDDTQAAHPYVSARTTVVVVDRTDGRARRLGDEARGKLARYLGEPLRLRA
jgi:acyl-CoA thioester hydrolase